MQPSVRHEKTKSDSMLATRLSLIERLANWDDQDRWTEFYDLYWRLIFNVARKAGLTEQEAQEVVQETVLTVAKNVARYDPKAGSFKGWLLNTTRWRINDQFRRREPGAQKPAREAASDDTPTIERIPGDDGRDLERAWDAEWEAHLFDTALDRVKRRVKPRQFQIFECLMVKQWPAARVAESLRVSLAQVYLTKHRLGSMMKKEVAALIEGASGR